MKQIPRTDPLSSHVALAEREQAATRALQLLASLGHDVRTPITGIQGFLNTLLADDLTWSPAEQREFLDVIAREMANLTAIIYNMVDYAALQSGTIHLRPYEVLADTLLDQMQPDLVATAGMHILYVQREGTLPSIAVDGVRVHQILNGLIFYLAGTVPQNASIQLRAQASSSPKPGLAVVIQQADSPQPETPIEGWAVLSQPDTVKRSYRAQTLALAVTAGLLRAMHGEIWLAESTPPWHWFQIWFPATASH